MTTPTPNESIVRPRTRLWPADSWRPKSEAPSELPSSSSVGAPVVNPGAVVPSMSTGSVSAGRGVAGRIAPLTVKGMSSLVPVDAFEARSASRSVQGASQTPSPGSVSEVTGRTAAAAEAANTSAAMNARAAASTQNGRMRNPKGGRLPWPSPGQSAHLSNHPRDGRNQPSGGWLEASPSRRLVPTSVPVPEAAMFNRNRHQVSATRLTLTPAAALVACATAASPAIASSPPPGPPSDALPGDIALPPQDPTTDSGSGSGPGPIQEVYPVPPTGPG